MTSRTSPHQGVVASITNRILATSSAKAFLGIFIFFYSSISFSQVLINEVVTDPQVDWSTNSFDGTDGLGAIDSNDEWIELYVAANGIDLTGWTIELNDGTDDSGTLAPGGAFTISNYVSGTGGLFTDTDAGDYVVIGQPTSGSMDATITIILRDNTMAIVDQVVISGGSGTFFTGASTGIANESVCRIPNGTDTNDDAADFVLTQATLGADNSPLGTVLINEVITDPQQDWSTNGFDGTIGGVTVTQGTDEWIELYIGTTGLNLIKWVISVDDGGVFSGDLTSRDATGNGAFQETAYFGSGSFTSTVAGDYLVLGNPQGSESMINEVTITITDPYGSTIDVVEIAAGSGTGFDGNASDIDDESICRIPNGLDTDIEADDFVQTRATLGANNSPQGIVLINELVVAPQQDWSASGFTDPAPGGSVGSTDEWIELYIGTSGLNLTKWTLEVTDGGFFSGDLTNSGAFEVTNYVGAGSFNNTVAGDFLILGNPTGSETITNDAYFELIHPDGTTIDDVEIGDDIEGDGAGDGAPDGSASGGQSTSIADEAIFRVPLGQDTDDDVADFRRGLASLGAENGIIYVDASAPDDTGFGRQSDPKQLIQSGLDIAVEDGRVMVASGTYNENITVTSPVSLEGANAGIDGNGTRGPESIIEPLTQSDALEIDADSVTIDGFQIGVALTDAAIYSTDNSYLNIQYNVINADSVGIALVSGSTGTYNITSNLITTSDFVTALLNPTSVVTLAGLNGDADVNLSDNEYVGSALGVFVFDCLSTNVLSVANDTTTNSIRGISVYSSNGILRASSSIAVNGFSASGFAEPPGGILNFPEAGIYFYSDGASTNSHLLTATITNSSFEGVENTTSDYAGIICGDFSGTNYAEYLQDITIINCEFTNNENRGLYARGQNTRASIQQSTFSGNGFDPTAAGGNPGFSIIARNDAEITVSNSVIINAAALAGAEDIPGNYFTAGLHNSAGGTISISGSSITNNGNGFIADGVGGNPLDMSGNWLGSIDEATIISLIQEASNLDNEVDFTPYLQSSADTNLVAAGFQGDFDALTVSSSGYQTSGDRVQEGHDLVNTGGEVAVLQSDYAELLTVSKNIVLNPEANTTIDDVTLDGGRLSVISDLEINNTLTLTNGILDIDLDDGDKSDDPVLILNNAVAGSFDDANHVEGKISKDITALGNFFFPVGDGDTYRPVTLEPLNSVTFAVSHIEEPTPTGAGTFGTIEDLVGTMSSVFNPLNIESVMNFRYWTIDVLSGVPGLTTITLQAAGADEITDPSSLGILRFDGLDWLELTLIGGSGSNPYTVSATTVSFSDFTLYSSDVDANPLPVELVDFKGRFEELDIRLSWSTLSEVNSDYFQIERSINGKEFTSIGSVSSHGNSSERHDYSYVDMNAGDQAFYYRLKMIDFDGSYEYSSTILMSPQLSDLKVRFFPNPTTNFIQIGGIETHLITRLTLHDLMGKIQMQINSLDQKIDISTLTTGTYLLRLELVDGSIYEGKLVRE